MNNENEVLECLDRIDHTLCLNNNKGNLEFGIDTEEHIDCDNAISMVEDLETIKQALLKAQEPKQYLKWEELKNSNLEEHLKVKLNNVKYELHFEKWARYDDATRISLYLNEFCVMSIRLKTNYEKQFFNDLHLEVVE